MLKHYNWFIVIFYFVTYSFDSKLTTDWFLSSACNSESESEIKLYSNTVDSGDSKTWAVVKNKPSRLVWRRHYDSWYRVSWLGDGWRQSGEWIICFNFTVYAIQ
jgi:hypothetical protein